MGYVYGSKCESRCLFLWLQSDRISDFLFCRVFCDGWVLIASFLWRQRRHFLMSCCSRVLVLAFPRWWWVRCSCILGVRCVWIKKCSLNKLCWRRKVCGYIFFVLWYPLLYLCTAWLNCCFFYSGFVHYVFCRQSPSRGYVSLSKQLHCLLECVVPWMVPIILLWSFMIWDKLLVQL